MRTNGMTELKVNGRTVDELLADKKALYGSTRMEGEVLTPQEGQVATTPEEEAPQASEFDAAGAISSLQASIKARDEQIGSLAKMVESLVKASQPEEADPVVALEAERARVSELEGQMKALQLEAVMRNAAAANGLNLEAVLSSDIARVAFAEVDASDGTAVAAVAKKLGEDHSWMLSNEASIKTPRSSGSKGNNPSGRSKEERRKEVLAWAESDPDRYFAFVRDDAKYNELFGD